MLPNTSVSFDTTSGKSVASDSVGLVVSPSSCSFLLMVDEVINKQKMSQTQPFDHEDIICTLPIMNNIISLCVLIMDN